MNDFSDMPNTSQSREKIFRRSDINKEGGEIKYAKKRPDKINMEDLKTIDQFYFNFNKDHPDKEDCWKR